MGALDLLPENLQITDLYIIVSQMIDYVVSVSTNQTFTTITCPAGSAIVPGTYFTIQSPDQGYYVWFKLDGVGIDPTPEGLVGILVNVSHTDQASVVAEELVAAMSLINVFVISYVSNIVSITNVSTTVTTPAVDVDSGLTIVTTSALNQFIIPADPSFSKILGTIGDQEALAAYYNLFVKPLIGTAAGVTFALNTLALTPNPPTPPVTPYGIIQEWFNSSGLMKPFEFQVLFGDQYPYTSGPGSHPLDVGQLIDLLNIFKNERSHLYQVSMEGANSPWFWDYSGWDNGIWDNNDGVLYSGTYIAMSQGHAFYDIDPTIVLSDLFIDTLYCAFGTFPVNYPGLWSYTDTPPASNLTTINESVIRGAGASDLLANNNGDIVVSVYQGSIAYTLGIDYTVSANQITWLSPLFGLTPPAAGSVYHVIYRYIDPTIEPPNDGIVNEIGRELSLVVEYVNPDPSGPIVVPGPGSPSGHWSSSATPTAFVHIYFRWLEPDGFGNTVYQMGLFKNSTVSGGGPFFFTPAEVIAPGPMLYMQNVQPFIRSIGKRENVDIIVTNS